MTGQVLCEVRVPTYRRPEMLRRALASLCAQTEPGWQAIVLDDGPGAEDGEAAAIVAGFDDSRIVYRANSGPRGAAPNIDRAFQTAAYGAAPYAFVLEDDNAVDPDFIQANIARLEADGAEIVLCNQRIGEEAPGPCYHDTGGTTRGDILPVGTIDVLTLRAAMFFCEGLSNGGVFWRTDAASDLQVGPSVTSAALQENVRTLQVRTPIVFVLEPLATFSKPKDGETTREPLENRAYNRARQAILRRLLRHHGGPLVKAARSLARTPAMRRQLSAQLADTLRVPEVLSDPRQGAKGLAKIATVADPLAAYWRASAAPVAHGRSARPGAGVSS